MPTYNISDTPSVNNYADKTNAVLKIKSVVTNKVVKFPAFLTDFSQTFDAKWNTEEVFGRMDPIATYQGTQRAMSLGFDVPAGSLEGAKNNLARCAELVKMVYPIYNNKGILSKPPLVRIRFANLIRGRLLIDEKATGTDNATEQFTRTAQEQVVDDTNRKISQETFDAGTYRQEVDFEQGSGEGGQGLIDATNAKSTDKYGMLLGWISGLSWKPNLEMGMFTTGEELYPKVISLSISYNILHEQTLSQDSSKIGSFPF